MKKQDSMTPEDIINELCARGVTKQDIAKNVGVTYAYVWQLGKGLKKGLSWDKMDKLKSYYDSIA